MGTGTKGKNHLVKKVLSPMSGGKWSVEIKQDQKKEVKKLPLTEAQGLQTNVQKAGRRKKGLF